MKKLFENWRKHITEAEYEPGRAVADIDTGEERMSPEDLMRDEVQDLADKFGVEASVEIASDGQPAILVTHRNGETMVYHDSEEMYQDLAKQHEMNEGAELKIPVERYDAFKRKIEQWGMLFNKFTNMATIVTHPDFDRKTDGRKILNRVGKLERELMKIMKEFDLDYKSYDDERHAMRQKLDRFDGDHEFFLEEES